MIRINAHTKIAAVIKANPEAIDAIASVNSHFRKLHNPVLRKILASRVTIAEAAKIGNVDISVLYEKLRPLGFLVDETPAQVTPHIRESSATHYDKMLDVRSDLSMGLDPFKKIMQAINSLPYDGILLLINSFEPTPLIRILREQGNEVTVAKVNEEVYHTYITRRREKEIRKEAREETPRLADLMQLYSGKITEIDVRSLPMPQPMMTILQQLDVLHQDHALFVIHKKVPMLLLPELRGRGFEYTWEQIENVVHLLIYRPQTAVP